MPTTVQSETGKIRRIVLKNATEAFVNPEKLEAEWTALNYHAKPNFEWAMSEYAAFSRIFSKHGIQIEFLKADSNLTIDSIYCRDASILTDAGAILCYMGKSARRGEPLALAEVYHDCGIPILGEIKQPGMIEGGDTAWIGPNTLAVGRGYRTNDEGIRQLKALAKGRFEVYVVPLPHFRGPSDVFHLMSMLSPIDDDLFLVYSPLMPVPFREYLLNQGIDLVEVPEEEFDKMGCNVLALAPRHCLMVEGCPITKKRLEEKGARVETYKGEEISKKGEGGPTCLTRPLEREY